MMKRTDFLLFFLLLPLFFSCSGSSDEEWGLPPVINVEPPAGEDGVVRRSCLAYIVADNDLKSYAQADLDEMLAGAVGVPSDCNMLVYVDDYDSPRILRFFNKNGAGCSETVYTFDREMASCDVADMRVVLEWVQLNYPAEKFDLIMWSHATGWLYDNGRRPSLYSFGDDWVRGENDIRRMNVEELAALLQSLPQKPERLFFDACFMQCAEVAYALRNCADWVIASPAEIPAAGAPYNTILPLLFNENVGLQAIMEAYKAAYAGSGTGVVLSAVRCSQMEALAAVAADVVVGYLGSSMRPQYDGLFAYLPGGKWGYSQKFPNYYDVNSVMLKYMPYDKYKGVKEALDAAVPYKVASDMWVSGVIGRNIYLSSSWSGISMYLPKDAALFPNNFNEDFACCEWYEAAGWREAGW
ncbi:MAG: hypothetical protein IJZ22_08670 [Bacteroidaceae bacterium]|nr:hypothetical protein [Bacteroidaceae bacterium]